MGTSTSLTVTSEGLPVLDALTIVTRSIHNCRVFGYYGGIQKLAALMKGKTISLVLIILFLHLLKSRFVSFNSIGIFLFPILIYLEAVMEFFCS